MLSTRFFRILVARPATLLGLWQRLWGQVTSGVIPNAARLTIMDLTESVVLWIVLAGAAMGSAAWADHVQLEDGKRAVAQWIREGLGCSWSDLASG